MFCDVIKLISETAATDEVGYPTSTETPREILCSVKSVGQSEFFNASQAGITPEFSFDVAAIEYNGEKICEYRNKRYAIYRTYLRGDTMELYAEYKGGV